MKAEDSFVSILFIGLFALLVFTLYMFFTGQFELFFSIVIVAVILLAIVGVLLYVIFGSYYAVTKKDRIHSGSGASLEDIKEVDREMEKK